jgi:hypothetical protein
MQSTLRNSGRGWTLEIETDTTVVSREDCARAALKAHNLEPGAVNIAYVKASTREDDL